MLLQGSLQEFSLANVLNLVKMSAKTGVLSLRRKGEHGLLYFRDGHVYYATLEPQVVPIGERLVRAGRITPEQLDRGAGRAAGCRRGRPRRQHPGGQGLSRARARSSRRSPTRSRRPPSAC